MKKITLIISIIQCLTADGQKWHGTFDGKIDAARIITSGDNILTITAAYVWDNGEGKSPEGGGSDYAWYGVKHGPYGSMHLLVYSPDNQFLLRHTYLDGNWETHEGTYEWLDNEGLQYVNYGVYDWDSYGYTSVNIVIYESDPKKVFGMFREHDYLFRCTVRKEESYCNLTYYNSNITNFSVQTTNLNYGHDYSYESILKIKNRTGEKINVYVKAFTEFKGGTWKWTDWMGPFIFDYNETTSTTLTDSDGWKIKGTHLMIYAKTPEGYKTWYKDEKDFFSIMPNCPHPPGDLNRFEYTFN